MKDKLMKQAEKELIEAVGEQRAKKIILDMKIGGILAGLKTGFMDMDIAQEKLLALLTSEVEKERERLLGSIEQFWLDNEFTPSYEDWEKQRKALSELKGGEK